uniref:DJ-1/PfpI family protein n=1 Tax=Pseudomonas soli TaxID=1306993 RepID=UPI0028AC25BC
ASSRRYGSVCTGAFALAAAGLLDERRITTHWAVAEALAQRYPQVTVEADAIQVHDGKVRTAAGVTAGLDLALALVEEDLGQVEPCAPAGSCSSAARAPRRRWGVRRCRGCSATWRPIRPRIMVSPVWRRGSASAHGISPGCSRPT